MSENEGTKVKLRMVKGETYACPAIFGPEKMLKRGDIIEVEPDIAEQLLEEFFVDGSNNEHHYFSESLEAPVKKAARQRRAAA